MRHVLLPLALPALAITGADVLDKMKPDEQAAHIAGAVDMAAQQDEARRACIVGWYYAKDHDAQKLVVQALEEYRDKQAVSILKALIKKQCP
jgi:hypothetical protein